MCIAEAHIKKIVIIIIIMVLAGATSLKIGQQKQFSGKLEKGQQQRQGDQPGLAAGADREREGVLNPTGSAGNSRGFTTHRLHKELLFSLLARPLAKKRRSTLDPRRYAGAKNQPK